MTKDDDSDFRDEIVIPNGGDSIPDPDSSDPTPGWTEEIVEK
jgi:hypothetical protein